jgi:hypothetical protein
MIQNTFRPAQIARIDGQSESVMGATILSIESQSKSLVGAVLAPLLGWLVDAERAADPAQVQAFWPVALVGVLTAVVALGFRSRRTSGAAAP